LHLQVYTSAKEALFVAARRSLCFPLCRNWKLTQRLLQDVKDLLALGRTAVVKAFLVGRHGPFGIIERSLWDLHCDVARRSALTALFSSRPKDMYDVMRRDDGKYVLLNIYLTDYCIWLQTVPHEAFEGLSAHINAIEICKDDLGFPLQMLETLVVTELEDRAAGGQDDGDSSDSEGSGTETGEDSDEAGIGEEDDGSENEEDDGDEDEEETEGAIIADSNAEDDENEEDGDDGDDEVDARRDVTDVTRNFDKFSLNI
jgi:protein SHQ1